MPFRIFEKLLAKVTFVCKKIKNTNLNWDLVLYLEAEELNVSYPIS